MRKIYFLFIMLALFAAGETNAQISVTGGSGLVATYSSFTKAGGLFEAINLTAQTGNNILVTITANINNEDGAISLNAGAWSTISIKPSGGTARTISGAVTAGLPMINFNGADNVTIDGLNTGGNSLTISNTTVSATAGTSTIKFFGDANNNTITNCSILGSSTTAAASNGGNIWFSAGAVTTGNDGNTISNCNIGAAGANLASKGIYFSGTTTTVALNNSGNSITGNNFIDIFNGGVASAGIYSGNGATANTITNNKFYQTGTRTFATGTFLHCAIQVNNTASAAGFTITGNTIGYASSTQTGTYTLAGATFAGKFNAIVFSGLTGGPPPPFPITPSLQ